MRDSISRDDAARPEAFVGAFRRQERHRIPRLYGRAAFAAAVEDGFLPDELGRVLAGRKVVDAFPVWADESVATYAHRAVSEMMLAYVSQDVARRDVA